MKFLSVRFFSGIITFFIGVLAVTFLYFGLNLQSVADKPSLSQIQTVMNENKSGIIFDGNNIDVIADTKSNFDQNPFDIKPKDEICFQKIEKKIESNLTSLGFRGETKYFRFNKIENVSDSKAFAFTLRPNSEQSIRLNLDFVKKLDTHADYFDSYNLYFLKNNQHEYLLIIGHESASSGIGHLYRTHMLVPLNSNKSIIELDTMFSDPRKIKIDDSGTIYYTQIESVDVGAVDDVNSPYFPVVVSLFTLDGEKSKKLEFNYTCKSKELFQESK